MDRASDGDLGNPLQRRASQILRGFLVSLIMPCCRHRFVRAPKAYPGRQKRRLRVFSP